ncbi:MAG: glycosyltransferase family 87 protein [Candidatus Binataceae bacterium]
MTLKVSGIVAAFSARRSGESFGCGVMPVPSLGWVVIIWGFTLGYVFALVGALPARMKEWDFGLYYASALSLRLGRNPYREPFTALADRLGLHLNGIQTAVATPTFLLAFEPLVNLPLWQAYWTWIGLLAACLVAALWLMLGRHSSRLPPTTALVLAAFAILYPPTRANFAAAQSQILILLILALMMRLLESGYDASASLLLSGAVLLRAYPLLLVGYFVLKRRWKVVAFTVAGVLAGGIVTVVGIGPARAFSFLGAVGLAPSRNFLSLNAIGSLPPQVAHSTDNGSIQNAMTMLFLLLYPRRSNQLATSIAARLTEVILLGLTLAATRSDTDDQAQEWPELCLWIAAMVMLPPISWEHYRVLLLIPYAQLVIAYNEGKAGRAALSMIVVSYCLTIVFDVASMGLSVPAKGVRILDLKWLPPLVLVQLMVPLSAYVAAYWTIKGGTTRRVAAQA